MDIALAIGIGFVLLVVLLGAVEIIYRADLKMRKEYWGRF